MTKIILVLLIVTGTLPLAIDTASIEGVPLVGLTAPTLLGIFFVMWMRGDIVSGKVHRERVQDYKDEATYWRDAHGVSEEARRTALDQNGEMIKGFQTIQQIADGIRSAARGE